MEVKNTHGQTRELNKNRTLISVILATVVICTVIVLFKCYVLSPIVDNIKNPCPKKQNVKVEKQVKTTNTIQQNKIEKPIQQNNQSIQTTNIQRNNNYEEEYRIRQEQKLKEKQQRAEEKALKKQQKQEIKELKKQEKVNAKLEKQRLKEEKKRQKSDNNFVNADTNLDTTE